MIRQLADATGLRVIYFFRQIYKVQFPMSPTKRRSISVATYFGSSLNKRAPPTKMSVAMGPSY